MKKAQIDGDTKINRYPEIFTEIKSIYETLDRDHPKKILSFGCSTGEEPLTLKELYFKNSHVVGYDINEKVILANKKTPNLTSIHFYSDLKSLVENDMASGSAKYDLIFGMSVFCKWPESKTKKYTFTEFEECLETVDGILKVGGYLCLYNTKFLFEETEIFKNYNIVSTRHKINGFVKKYNKTETYIEYDNKGAGLYYGNFLYKKIKD